MRPATCVLLIAVCLGWAAALTRCHAVTFDWAHVGNAGNAADPQTGFGAVAYNYAISKTEVTNVQYVEFLNAVDPTGANSLALYAADMAGNFGGIENTGGIDGARYVAQAGREQNPVTYVSFFDAMRFTNWLHNGQGPAGSPTGATESGAYTIGNGIDEVRSANARFWIPSEDEWYKAAYHDASAGTAGTYFDYAIGSDSVPVSDQPGDNPTAVNYFNNDDIANGFNDGYAVSGTSSIGANPLTDVGSYTAALSPYGTVDQNGNAFEWNEGISNSFRAMRGGSWSFDSLGNSLHAGARSYRNPGFHDPIVGLRVATIPEPSGLLLGLLAAVGVVRRGLR